MVLKERVSRGGGPMQGVGRKTTGGQLAPPGKKYLTLCVLSSLDQESMEGKEGMDEEVVVTNPLLPI